MKKQITPEEMAANLDTWAPSPLSPSEIEKIKEEIDVKNPDPAEPEKE